MDEIENEDVTSDDTTAEVVETEPTIEELKAQLEETRAQRDKQFKRAKKAEGFIEQSDGTWLRRTEASIKKPELISSDPIEVATLANSLRDLSPQEVDYAKIIAKGSETSLLEAIKTDGFQIFHKAKVAERRKEDARLGASKGSGQIDSNGIKPGMTVEEHKAAWKALN